MEGLWAAMDSNGDGRLTSTSGALLHSGAVSKGLRENIRATREGELYII